MSRNKRIASAVAGIAILVGWFILIINAPRMPEVVNWVVGPLVMFAGLLAIGWAIRGKL